MSAKGGPGAVSLVSRALALLVGAEWAGPCGAALVAAYFVASVWLSRREARRAAEARRAKAALPRRTSAALEGAGVESGSWRFSVGLGRENAFVGEGKGRSTWVPCASGGVEAGSFSFDREKNPNTADRVYRAAMLSRGAESGAASAAPLAARGEADLAALSALRGSQFYARLQTEQGFWPGDYGGPMFLLPGLVIACHVTGVELGAMRRAAMLRYIMGHQQACDGGWGMHIEGRSTVFGSVLNYAAARLLGLARDDARAVRGRALIRSLGGALAAPQWAKFWLATLGAYEWQGVNPTPPELWLLPEWCPFHPGKMWCHARMVYLPMSALFGSRWVYAHAEHDSTVLALREELYCGKYEDVAWGSLAVRERIAETDVFNRQSRVMTLANHVLHNTLEHPWVRAVLHVPLAALRRRALAFCFDYIHAEDVHTNWVDIGPVSKAFHLIATHARWGPASAEFLNHVGRIDDYLWMAEDGLKMQGYNGSMFWDTCFATHAVASTLVACERLPTPPGAALAGIQGCLARACEFVDDMQVREDVWRRDDFFRDRSLGGWPFSTRDHGWPISDCTAEGIKAALLLEERLQGRGLRMVPRERIEQAVRIILDLQNSHKDQGWASYEQNRGYDWYELFNPAQVFGDIMVDYSYVECSSAAVQALCEYAHRYPDGQLAARALDAARRGAGFIVAKQRPDGAWYGSWAVCFTYAAWFGVEGLAAAIQHCGLAGRERHAALAALHKGCQFLLDKQRAQDGGWGEDVRSCAEQRWVECEQGGQVVQTGWAVMALVKAAELLAKQDPAAAKRFILAATRGSQFLRARQLPSGDWDQECISGVFNKSCAITYTAYRNVFPIWALARYSDYVNRTAADQ